MQNPLRTMRIRGQIPNHGFGMVRNAGRRPHQGWDLAAPVGTPVYAIADGVIRDLRQQGAYGLQVSLEFTHRLQTMYAFYAHLSSVTCAQGQHVSEGELLGYTGKTGNARNLPPSQDHLHFEIRLHSLRPGRGLTGRIDPGEILGYHLYASHI